MAKTSYLSTYYSEILFSSPAYLNDGYFSPVPESVKSIKMTTGRPNNVFFTAKQALAVKDSSQIMMAAASSSIDPDVVGTNDLPILIAETFVETSILLFSLVGNLLVLGSVFAIRGLRSKKTNLIFVFALTIADLFVTIFVMPFHILQNALGYWPFGSTLCDIFIGNDVFFCTASLLGIMCIAIERYIAVFKPLRYNSLMTSRIAIGIVCGAWLASFILSHVPVKLHLHLVMKQPFNSENDLCQFEVNPIYALVSSAISYWLPCLVMSFVYLRIYFGAKRQLDQLCQAAPLLVHEVWPFPVVTKHCEIAANNNNNHQEGGSNDDNLQQNAAAVPLVDQRTSNKAQPKKKGATLRTKVLLGRILGCFIICWSPFFTLLVLNSIGALSIVMSGLVIGWLFKAALWLSYANSIANPFIYAMSNHEIAALWRKWRLSVRHDSNNSPQRSQAA